MMDVRILTKMAVCVSLLCLSSYIFIPLPFTAVILSAWTLAINITALVLPPRETFLTMLGYMLLGAVGLPVFTGGIGGLGKLFGPTGGFIFGFLLAMPLMSYLKGAANDGRRFFAVAVLIGMTVSYVGGVFSMCAVQDIDVMSALAMAVIPFVPGDLFKAAAASYIAVKINRISAGG